MTSNATSIQPVTTVDVPAARSAGSTSASSGVVDEPAVTAADTPADGTTTDDTSTDGASTDGTSTDGTTADEVAANEDRSAGEAPEQAVAEQDVAEQDVAEQDDGTAIDEADLGPDAAGLHERMVEARERLRPEGPVIPAPRSPQGVMVPPTFGRGRQPDAAVVAAVDQVVAELAAVRARPDEPAHRALVCLGALAAGEIPDAGWSRDAGLEPDVVAAAADLATELHVAVTTLLERLDAEELTSSAVVVDGVATTLRVMRMVADLEVFARARG